MLKKWNRSKNCSVMMKAQSNLYTKDLLLNQTNYKLEINLKLEIWKTRIRD